MLTLQEARTLREGTTPGPWRVEEGTTLTWGACNADDTSTRGMGYPITDARISPCGNWAKGPDCDEGQTNASMIAAAPDLLDLVEAQAGEIAALTAQVEALRGAADDVIRASNTIMLMLSGDLPMSKLAREAAIRRALDARNSWDNAIAATEPRHG